MGGASTNTRYKSPLDELVDIEKLFGENKSNQLYCDTCQTTVPQLAQRCKSTPRIRQQTWCVCVLVVQNKRELLKSGQEYSEAQHFYDRREDSSKEPVFYSSVRAVAFSIFFAFLLCPSSFMTWFASHYYSPRREEKLVSFYSFVSTLIKKHKKPRGNSSACP